MFENGGKGVKRNEPNLPHERAKKAARIGMDVQVRAQEEIPGLGQSQGGPTASIPSYDNIETDGMSRISMEFNGESGQTLKQSFIESIQGCPTDLHLICTDGVADVHRFILMGVSKFFFQLLRDRDPKDTEAITLVDVSIVHLSIALELIYTGTTTVKESEEESVLEVLDLFGIKLQLERKEAIEEDLAMHVSLQQAESGENGGTSENEAENAEASNNNANTNHAVEEVDVIVDEFGVASGNETETGVIEAIANHQVSRPGRGPGPFMQPQQMETNNSYVQVEVDKENDSLPPGDNGHDDNNKETGEDACNIYDRNSQGGEDEPVLFLFDLTPDNEEDKDGNNRNSMTVADAGPGQFDLRQPYQTEGHITLNGKQICWHLMEALLPSLTSPELLHERMRVFSLARHNQQVTRKPPRRNTKSL